MASAEGVPSIALHVAGEDDDRLVSVPLRRVEPGGTMVLGLRHPQGFPIGRVLSISTPGDLGWQMLRVRVEAPRFRPHEDAGLLRLAPLPADEDAVKVAAAASEPATTDEAQAAAMQPPPAGRLRPWHGRHPLGGVALRLASGRVRTMLVRRIDEDGGLVLDMRRPSVLAEGDEVEIAWSDGRGWATATTCVLAAWPDGHPDAGLLRLGLRDEPKQQKERRSWPRGPIRLALRGTVERGAQHVRGSRFESATLDLSLGGASLASDLDLAPGDRLIVRLIGATGQLPGGEVTSEVLRLEPLPGRTERKVVIAWRDPPAELQRALRHLIDG
jgi:hypothetical protein